jgi:hypothetical protein
MPQKFMFLPYKEVSNDPYKCRGSMRAFTQKLLAEQHSSLAHFLFLFLAPHLTAGFDGLMKGLSQ